jgi:hypothetical protein
MRNQNEQSDAEPQSTPNNPNGPEDRPTPSRTNPNTSTLDPEAIYQERLAAMKDFQEKRRNESIVNNANKRQAAVESGEAAAKDEYGPESLTSGQITAIETNSDKDFAQIKRWIRENKYKRPSGLWEDIRPDLPERQALEQRIENAINQLDPKSQPSGNQKNWDNMSKDERKEWLTKVSNGQFALEQYYALINDSTPEI